MTDKLLVLHMRVINQFLKGNEGRQIEYIMESVNTTTIISEDLRNNLKKKYSYLFEFLLKNQLTICLDISNSKTLLDQKIYIRCINNVIIGKTIKCHTDEFNLLTDLVLTRSNPNNYFMHIFFKMYREELQSFLHINQHVIKDLTNGLSKKPITMFSDKDAESNLVHPLLILN